MKVTLHKLTVWLLKVPARINQLTAAWEVMYLEESWAMDVFFMGGIEDIIRGCMGPSIIKALKYFVELVEWQGRKHPEEPNTCSIFTLYYYPPKLCWLEDDKLIPSTFDNQLRNIRWLNQKSYMLSLESKFIRFHVFESENWLDMDDRPLDTGWNTGRKKTEMKSYI